MKFQLRRCGAAILAILTVGGIAAVGGMLLRNAGKKLVSASSAAAIPASTGNWGLSFQTEGASPVGNATTEQLAQYNACFLGDTTKKVIYLTFDCGYENGYTETILDALKKHQAPAAFFVVGNMIETAPDIIRRMAEEGHIVGNHTYHHPDMSKISSQAAFKKELDDLAALYKETTGQEMPRYYRPPQGKYNEENLRQAQALGYRTVFWSLAYVDWYVDNQPSAEQAYSKLLPRIHDGAVVLLHSTSKTNAEILDELLTKWEEMGYTFASLDQLPA
ncbi:MAG: delta-lactam-biosynthetic de-N-acetylase [Oscillibacter sp.]|jgi:peptidoglycan-N-acetylmuramic acid deacetylase|nr:delta-lactam-biosynthetic de-N-acetylase [Oscillibacter sp.]